MLNILATERMKLKHDKLILACTLLALLLPVCSIAADIHYLNTGTFDWELLEWLFRLSLPCQLLAYPLLSSFVITFLIQREYSDHTIINTLTAPVDRIKFLMTKVIIWVLWNLIITIAYLFIVYIGIYLLYGYGPLMDNLSQITEPIIKTGIFNIITLTPILWVAIMQRKNFYPSLLVSIVIIGIGFVGIYWPDILTNLLPWSATYVLTYCTQKSMEYLPYISTIGCGILGLMVSTYCMKKQEL